MGVLGGDNAGFPNGRRLADDVVDIEEQAVAGFLKGKKVPLGDGVNANDVANLGHFPYEAVAAVRLRQRQGRAEALIHRVRGGAFAAPTHEPNRPLEAGEYARGHEIREGVGSMKRTILAVAAVAAAALAAVAAALVGPGPGNGTGIEPPGGAAHRGRPGADNTDVYAFVSPDKPDTVTIIANYIPLEEPAGGPNFYQFDDDVLYEIKVDNTGDGGEDVTYEFRFRTKVRNPNTFLYNTGPIDTLSDPDWNVKQFYSVTRVERRRERRRGSGRAPDVPTPPVNIGPRSTPSYGSLMAAAVKPLPGGGQVFAGQVDDPFFVDLGSIFDLAGLRPFNPAHLLPLPAAPGVDGVGGFNTHTIAHPGPDRELTATGGCRRRRRSRRRDRRLRDARAASRPGCSSAEAGSGRQATGSRSRGSATR